MLRNTAFLPLCILLGALLSPSMAAEPPAGPVVIVGESNVTDGRLVAVPAAQLGLDESTNAKPETPSGAESVSVGGPVQQTPGSVSKEPAAEASPSSGNEEKSSTDKQSAPAEDKRPRKKTKEKAKSKDARDETMKPSTAGAKSESTPPEQSPSSQSPPKRTLTPAMAALQERVRRTLPMYFRQTLNTQESTVSDVIDFCLAFGCESEVQCAAAGKQINAITCLCWNYPCAGFSPLIRNGEYVAARVGFGLQERPGELLAVLAQARVPANYPVRVSGEAVHSVADLAEYEKCSIRSAADLSLQLIGLAHYVEEPDWKNDLGQLWSIERIIHEELEHSIASAADGGTTRLLALSYAVDRRQRRRQLIDGEFARAQKFTADYQGFALARQNPDGSWGPYFSAAKAAGATAAVQLHSTGRMLEWLSFALPDDKLEDARIVRSVEFVCSLLDGQRSQWNLRTSSARDLGSITHALHALVIYDGRVFESAESQKPQ